MKMRFLPDKPLSATDADDLGFGEFVEVLQTSIYNTETPFVYGVLGDWGTGKTSIMQLLQHRLEQDLQNGVQPFVPIWFNAWKYENEENIVYPLLYGIKRDYDERISQTAKSQDFPQKFRQVVASSTLALADVGLRVITKHLTGEAIKVSDIEQQINKVREHAGNLETVLNSWADEVRKLDDAFKVMLTTYAQDLIKSNSEFRDSSKVKFVILIDDLDRCLPETTIAVLESIKNYLLVENCIFVLGVNPKIIYQGIRVKYKNLEVDGREYLEKILNYSFYVPEPELGLAAKFASERLKRLVLDEAKQRQYDPYFVKFGQILQECQFNNPRKIKRILNRYLFFISKYETELDQYDNKNIVRLLVMAEYFPELFQLFLVDAPKVTQQIDKIGKFEFDIKKFENDFGISIASHYSQLARMRQLFNLDVQTDPQKPDLTKHAQVVFSITRLI